MIILSSMVMVLLAIRQLGHFEGFDDSEETHNLREDLEEKGDVLSNNNIFSSIVETEEDNFINKKQVKSRPPKNE